MNTFCITLLQKVGGCPAPAAQHQGRRTGPQAVQGVCSFMKSSPSSLRHAHADLRPDRTPRQGQAISLITSHCKVMSLRLGYGSVDSRLVTTTLLRDSSQRFVCKCPKPGIFNAHLRPDARASISVPLCQSRSQFTTRSSRREALTQPLKKVCSSEHSLPVLNL